MKHNINYIGKITAIISFVIGTTILSIYLYFGLEYMNLLFALGYVTIAIIVNTLIFVAIIASTFLNRINKLEAFKTCSIMLLNIPIAFLYFYMIITFPNHNIQL